MSTSQQADHYELQNIVSLHDHALVLFHNRNFRSSYCVFTRILCRLKSIYEGRSKDRRSESNTLGETNDYSRIERALRIESSNALTSTTHTSIDCSMEASTSSSLTDATYLRPKNCQEVEIFTGAFCLRKLCSVVPATHFEETIDLVTAVVLFNLGLTLHLTGIQNGMQKTMTNKVQTHYERSYHILQITHPADHSILTEENQQYLELLSLMQMTVCLNMSEVLRSSAFVSASVEDKVMTKNLHSTIKVILDSFLIRKASGGAFIAITINDIHFFYNCLATAMLVDHDSMAPAA